MRFRPLGRPAGGASRHCGAISDAGVALQGAQAAAARRCGISQPSLLAQIAALERLVGMTLIERARSGAVPTPAEREVCARGRDLLASARAIAEFGTRGGAGLTGTVRFRASSTMGPCIMPQVVAALHAAHPDLRLYIREGAPRVRPEDLLRGSLDMILTRLPVVAEDAMVLRPFREPIELIVPRDHPPAASETVARGDLAGARVPSPGPAYALHGLVAGLCETLNMRLLRDDEGTSLDAVRLMVGMGMGIAFLPAL